MATVSGVPIIGGLTFDFTESGYISPSASGTIYNFGCGEYILNQIWSDDNYVYAACDFGLDIIDKVEEEKIAYIHNNDGYNTVWANNDKVYLGTSASGVKYFHKTCISGTVLIPNNLYTCLVDYTSPFGISSQTIRYIHGSSDDYLMCCTNSGVDVYHMKMTEYRSTTTVSGAQKCFMTSSGKFYYTTVSGATVSGVDDLWSLNRVDKPLWDWIDPDYIYYTGGDILPAGLIINDMFITENTSSNEIDNTIFIATTSGVYVIDEETLDYVVYYTGG